MSANGWVVPGQWVNFAVSVGFTRAGSVSKKNFHRKPHSTEYLKSMDVICLRALGLVTWTAKEPAQIKQFVFLHSLGFTLSKRTKGPKPNPHGTHSLSLFFFNFPKSQPTLDSPSPPLHSMFLPSHSPPITPPSPLTAHASFPFSPWILSPIGHQRRSSYRSSKTKKEE